MAIATCIFIFTNPFSKETNASEQFEDTTKTEEVTSLQNIELANPKVTGDDEVEDAPETSQVKEQELVNSEGTTSTPDQSSEDSQSEVQQKKMIMFQGLFDQRKTLLMRNPLIQTT